MDEQRQDVQLGPTYNSSVPIQDVALKTYRKVWRIEKDGGGGPRKSMLAAQLDDDDDDSLLFPPSFDLKTFSQEEFVWFLSEVFKNSFSRP